MGPITKRVYSWAKDRSGIVDALHAFADGRTGSYGDGRLRTDGHALLFCNVVPVALIICHQCHHAVRVDGMRIWSDIGDNSVTSTSAWSSLGTSDKVWLVFVLGYLEAMMPGIAPRRVSILNAMREKIASGEIQPCDPDKPKPDKAGQVELGRVVH